ncbi:conserved hypothetical protein [Neospora caninum Liverpool]|uniref:Nucleolar protein 9 n=1 Tax=Neospora caninum (strain Liverpool) TaxID=572307 RepID=F0VB93_NEOCL|nr:conserved hypothetical protein [Neospora caninum Liverpool]CBZ50877.1 conserved hypothetical protein [Neospora caninum Liverpool]CEL68179.1 TPA: hypothetical protein BN1204_039520 [Neospora caninum Liverpool]|eukprot:XP_003880910.1 conserved hypothetical protein [Neospora caninum Liverpool]
MAKSKRRGGRRHKRVGTAATVPLLEEGEEEPFQEGSEDAEEEREDAEDDALSSSTRIAEKKVSKRKASAAERATDGDQAEADASLEESSSFGRARAEKEGKSKGGKRTADGYVEYLAHVKQVIDERAFKSDEEWETFVAATAEEIASKTPLALTDQRSSKVVEKILGLLAGFLSARDVRRDQKQSVHAFRLLLRKISGSAGQLAVHASGSHVLQTLFGALPCVLDAERRLKQAGDDEGSAQSVEDLALYSLHAIESEQGGWVSLMRHSSGSHVFRAVVRAAAGIYSLPSVDELGRRKPRKSRQETTESLPVLSQPGGTRHDSASDARGAPGAQLFPANESLLALLKQIAKDVAAALNANPYSLLFDVYASPALQLLLHVTASTPQFEQAKTRLLAAIFRLDTQAETRREEMMQLADALVDSPTGSRVLEVAALMLAPETFQVFFSSWMLKRINHLAQGRFGNFILQKLLASPLVQTAHVRQLVGALDFDACLASKTPAVLWRLSEACRRVRASQGEFAKRLFAALNLQNPKYLPFSWFSLLALAPPEALSPSLCFFGTPDDPAAEAEGEKKVHTLRHLSEMITPTGVSIVLSLLRFAPAAIQPLIAGFKKFVKILKRTSVSVRQWRGKELPPLWEERPVMLSLAIDAQGSRLLEGVVKTAAVSHSAARREDEGDEADGGRNAPFPPQAVQQLLKAFCGNYAQAALHPTGGFVVTTFYDAATVDVKRRIVRELLDVEEELREKNYAAYVKCEVHKFKQSEEGWTARQEKKSKTRELFRDLLAEDEGVEATDATVAEEAENDEQRAAAEAARAFIEGDAVASQLLGVETTKGEKKREKGKKRPPPSDSDEDVFGESGSPHSDARQATAPNINEDGRGKKHRRERTKRDEQGEKEKRKQPSSGAPAEASDAAKRKEKKRKDEKANASTHEDKTLEAALFFIEGTRSDLSKRQLAKRRKLEASKLADAGASVAVH